MTTNNSSFVPSFRGAPRIRTGRWAPPGTAKPNRQPSKAAKQRVRDAFDAEKLIHICSTWDFDQYATRVDLPDSFAGRKRFYYYKDNGSDILAIAHLDSVQSDGRCTVADTAAGLLAVSGTLDDRLGAYVILELLPKLGITCDWLLTTDEEIGQSTAGQFFPKHKQYNWMFQFDRGGTDVVMYEYESPEFVELVEDAGAQIGIGSYSDICLLDDLGCVGFNWGVGYRDYHAARSHAWLEDTFRMVARFVKFYGTNAVKFLEYDPWVPVPKIVTDDDENEAAAFWVRAELLVGDCAHAVDLGDPDSYVELDGGDKIVCTACGTMPQQEEATG